VPALSSEGSELGPSAATPFSPTLTVEVLGVHVLELVVAARQVLRRKMSLKPFVWFVTRLVELEAKATKFPVWLTDGPAVVRVGVPEHVAPQIPLFAGVPSGARSTITGRPAKSVGFTANVSVLEVPPPGTGLTTCTWSIPPAARSPAVRVA
jgi:hypothetical protein